MSGAVRQLRLAVLLSVVLVSAVAGCGTSGSHGSGRACTRDPVRERALGQLSSYVGWLAEHHVRGYVGEVGWPGGADAARWNALADAWYRAADEARLPVTAWAAGEWWPADYPLAVYRSGTTGQPLSVTGPQARVVERHGSTAGAARGVGDGTGSFGADDPAYSAQQPGVYGQSYAYPSAPSFDFLAAHGVSLVRLAFTWERVQPRLGGPLAPSEVRRLRQTVRAAHAAGLRAVLDLHSYARYRTAGPDGGVEERVLGTPELPAADLADVWRRLAGAFRGEPGVWGYGLMNEPHDLPGPRGGAATWESASQLAVDAIREVDPHTQLLVAGAGWSKVADWARTHPKPWIRDPARDVRYEAHQYFDGDGSGRYGVSYRVETAEARRAGASSGC